MSAGGAERNGTGRDGEVRRTRWILAGKAGGALAPVAAGSCHPEATCG